MDRPSSSGDDVTPRIDERVTLDSERSHDGTD